MYISLKSFDSKKTYALGGMAGIAVLRIILTIKK